jgi:Ser-tRNA(Ala) deacylase AlaX
MFNRERQIEHFKNHVATLKDYGDIKVLDFKNPESINYRIRFIFEEDWCRCHISGDLG